MAFEKENREAERFPVNANANCVFVSPVVDEFGPVKIKNISTTGVGLIASKKPAIGDLLVVKLANAAKQYTKMLLVRVVHVTEQRGGIFLIGATLDAPLTYEELCIFVM